jgi:hypothetical protein
LFIALFQFSPMRRPFFALFQFSPTAEKKRNEYASFNLDFALMAAHNEERASLLSKRDVSNILREQGNILVNPFLYLEVLERARLLGIDARKIFTFTSVSLAGTNDFAYYVDYKRTYPEWVNSLMTAPAALLPGHVCAKIFEVGSENSSLIISVRKLTRADDKVAVFSDCP